MADIEVISEKQLADQSMVDHSEAAIDSSVSCNESKQRLNQFYSFSCKDFIVTSFSVSIFCVDVLLDIWLAKHYYDDGKTFECILTASVVVAAFLVTGILNAFWLWDNTSGQTCLNICLVILTFPFATIGRCILYLYHGYNSKIHHKGIKQLGHYINITYLNHGYQSKQKISKKDYHYIEMIINEMYASLLSMFDAFIESAPQLLLQIYLILKEQENFKDCEHISIYSYIIRLFAVLTSWISVTWSVTAFYRAHRVTNDMHKTRQKTVFAAMGYFLWRAFEIGSRVMALVMIFLMNGIIFAMAVVIHWIVMVIFSFATKTRPYEKNHQNVIFILFVGFVQIFSFMNASRFKFPYHTVDDNHAEEVNPLESSDHAEEVNPHDKCYPTEPRHHALLYYLFVYTENIVILIVWILVKNNSFCPWIYHGSIGIVSSGLICNIVFMISYYKLCHPTISIFR